MAKEYYVMKDARGYSNGYRDKDSGLRLRLNELEEGGIVHGITSYPTHVRTEDALGNVRDMKYAYSFVAYDRHVIPPIVRVFLLPIYKEEVIEDGN